MSARIPIADAPLLGRAVTRTRLVRTGLALAIGLLLAAAIVLASRLEEPQAVAAVPSGRPLEIVLDVSGSVGEVSYGPTRQTLLELGRSGRPVGLVLFSDTAEEALPPGTPARLLRPFAAQFRPTNGPPPIAVAAHPPRYQPNPWYASFSGGTRISAGLAAAREALRREGVGGTVLLISDLGDAPEDQKAMRRELAAVSRDGFDLRILPLPNAFPSDRRQIERLVGAQPFADPLPAPQPVRPARAEAAGFPVALAVVAGLLAVALGAELLAGRSLRWGAAR